MPGPILYLPKGFDQVKYESFGDLNQVVATNKKTGEVLVIAHVEGLSSNQAEGQKQLRQRLDPKNATTNSEGSRLIGQLGGPGADSPGTRHSHITLYQNAEGRRQYQARKPGGRDYSGTADLRKTFTQR